MTTILIRQLYDNDVHDFRCIRLSSLQNNPEMFGSSYAVEVKRPLHVFAEALHNNAVFAAYVQNQIIGVLILHIADDVENQPKAQLYGFFVELEYRNQGIAKQILQTVLEHAQAYVKQVKLSVMASNIAAIQL